MIRIRNLCWLLLLCLFCCRKPYTPPVTTAASSYLVVEGVINSGSDSTIIKLSKTVKLNAQITLNPVTGATVTVESDQNGNWPLIGDGAGNYVSPALNLPASQNYRLRVNTNDGHQYLSDFVPVKPTPPIDSIGYAVKNNAIQLYINAHDPANNTHYYRWDYGETWIFHAKYFSDSRADPATGTIVQRTQAQMVYYCFGNDISSNILLTSTAKLSQDVVYQAPLTNISFASEKLESKYSILVKQYALTADAYQFYLNMKTNTEQLGSIFDAQPSQLIGNIHNVANANEPVVGYLSVTNVQTRRIFIPGTVVPTGFPVTYPYDCMQDSALYITKLGYNDVQNLLIDPPYTLEATIPIVKGGDIIGYEYSTPFCMDCTLRGTTQTPPFWK